MHDEVVETVRNALTTGELGSLGGALAGDVRWYGSAPGGGCRSRDEVLVALGRALADAGPRLSKIEVAGDRLVLRLDVPRHDGDNSVWFVLTLDSGGRIAEIQDYSTEAAVEHDAAVRAGDPPPASPVSGLVPFVHVAYVERSIAFYRLLGFEAEDTYAPDGRPVWAALRSEDARLMVAEAGTPIRARDQAVLFYLYARDLDALRDYLVAHGATPGEIVDGTPGPRQEMRVTDPDGYYLMVAQVDDETILGTATT